MSPSKKGKGQYKKRLRGLPDFAAVFYIAGTGGQCLIELVQQADGVGHGVLVAVGQHVNPPLPHLLGTVAREIGTAHV